MGNSCVSVILSRMELGPSKFSTRSATVTIHTTHIALVDLGSHACPSLVHHHAADLGELLSAIAMVELEHDRICVAAVNAWMCPEVGEYFAPILDTMSLDLRDRATVELEHNGIHFAAINARVRRQVLRHVRTIACSIDRGAHPCSRHVSREVLVVVLLTPLPHARPAVRDVPALRDVLEPVLDDGF